MARKNKAEKTKYSNIYKVENIEGKTEFLATWTQRGRQYPQKNLTNLFGCTTAKQASDKLDELKVLINKGEEPFKKEDKTKIKTISELVLSEIRSRNAGEDYKYTQEKIYLKHLDPIIGHLTLEKLDIAILHKLFTELKKNNKPSGILNMKKTIRPTLDYAVDEKILTINPLNSKRVKKLTKMPKTNEKAPLKHRISGKDNMRFLATVQALYKTALTFKKEDYCKIKVPDESLNNEFQIVYLMVSMTARRRSEILSIDYKDITDYGTVKSYPDITKTDVWDEYPIPKEVIERLDPNGKGKIAPRVTKKTYSTYMRHLIDGLNINIHHDMKLDGHDTRHLFLTIMSKETKNPFLCDSALSHSAKEYKMLLTYYEPDVNDYTELFELYWSLLRGDKQLEN